VDLLGNIVLMYSDHASKKGAYLSISPLQIENE